MKTISLKKVAVVAVASLGFGLMSVVPANAADSQSASGTVSSINLKAASANTLKTGAAQTVFVGSTQVAQASPGAGNNLLLNYKGYLSSYPAGGYVSAVADKDTAGLTLTGETSKAESGSTLTMRMTADTAVTAETVTATGTTGLGNFSFTPTVAGTYVLTVWNDQDVDGVVDVTEAVQTVSLTVAAAADLVPAASVVNMTGTTGGAAASSSTNAIPRSAAATAGTYIAQVKVNLYKSDGTADTRNHTLTCEISGSGYCGFAAVNTDPNSTARSTTDSTGAADRYVGIESDGTAGTGTVTIYVTHLVTGVKTQIYSGSYTSYGDVTKLAVDSKIYTIGRAGYTTGAADANLGTRTAAGNLLFATSATGTVPAFIVKMTDAGGRAANRGAAPTVISSNTAVVTGGTCVLDDGSAVATGDSSSVNGVGYYNCNFKTSASAKSGDKATLTLRVTDPADTTVYLTTTIDVTVGGSIATETIAFDKTSYAPGEGMTITRTAKDSAGNPVYDGAGAPDITFTKSVGGTAPTGGQYVGGTKSSTSSTGVKSVFAPAVAGSFSMLATSGNAAGSALSASASVTDANAGLLTQIDALNAKIVALNALIAKIMKKLGVK